MKGGRALLSVPRTPAKLGGSGPLPTSSELDPGMTEAAMLRSPVADGPDAVGAVRRGGSLYFATALFAQFSALLRYVILARLLGPEQLGLAATLVVTASFFDMISDTGGERFLIQDRDGGTPQVQSLVQAVTVARGFIVCALLLMFCVPLAWFYHTPRLAGGLAVLAIAPAIAGFQHLDNRRVQREHDFRAEAISYGCAEVVGFTSIVIAAWLTRDFTAVLYSSIARALALVLTSHLRATRPYRLGWDREHAPRLLRFAIPLVVNGILVFIASQGDRVLVGHQLGVKALGYYSAVTLLIFYPTSLLARYQYALNIPLIAARRDDPAAQKRVVDRVGAQTMLLSIGMAAGFAAVAPVAMPLLFGHRFTQTPLVVALIGCLQTARFMANWPNTVALAIGRSTTVLLANIGQGLAFATALAGMALLGGLIGLVSGFIVGQLIAVAIAIGLVNWNLARPIARRLDLVAICAANYALIVATDLVLAERRWLLLAGLSTIWTAWIAWVCRREAHVIADGYRIARLAAQRFWSGRKLARGRAL
jgi:O-antigen/teichoic acid export membrane protein